MLGTAGVSVHGESPAAGAGAAAAATTSVSPAARDLLCCTTAAAAAAVAAASCFLSASSLALAARMVARLSPAGAPAGAAAAASSLALAACMVARLSPAAAAAAAGAPAALPLASSFALTACMVARLSAAGGAPAAAAAAALACCSPLRRSTSSRSRALSAALEASRCFCAAACSRALTCGATRTHTAGELATVHQGTICALLRGFSFHVCMIVRSMLFSGARSAVAQCAAVVLAGQPDSDTRPAQGGRVSNLPSTACFGTEPSTSDGACCWPAAQMQGLAPLRGMQASQAARPQPGGQQAR
jgi:hypothetical protein